MATSGTTAFTLDFAELAEESWERAGREMRSGYDLRTARRSMNLLTIEWQNRGINLWTIDEGSVALVAGTAAYAIPADTVDLLEQLIRTNSGNVSSQTDVNLTRISASVYASIPNKLSTGRPVQCWVKRGVDNPEVTVWPVPIDDSYTLQYWRLRRLEDAGNGVETQDMNYRFLPAAAAGLAYYIAMKVPELIERVPMLQAEYDRQFTLAKEEDRDKVPSRFIPRIARV